MVPAMRQFWGQLPDSAGINLAACNLDVAAGKEVPKELAETDSTKPV
jgi:hypothetical protein